MSKTKRAGSRLRQLAQSNGYTVLGPSASGQVHLWIRCSSWSWHACSRTRSWSGSHWARAHLTNSSGVPPWDTGCRQTRVLTGWADPMKRPSEVAFPRRTRSTCRGHPLRKASWSFAIEVLKIKYWRWFFFGIKRFQCWWVTLIVLKVIVSDPDCT